MCVPQTTINRARDANQAFALGPIPPPPPPAGHLGVGVEQRRGRGSAPGLAIVGTPALVNVALLGTEKLCERSRQGPALARQRTTASEEAASPSARTMRMLPEPCTCASVFSISLERKKKRNGACKGRSADGTAPRQERPLAMRPPYHVEFECTQPLGCHESPRSSDTRTPEQDVPTSLEVCASWCVGAQQRGGMRRRARGDTAAVMFSNPHSDAPAKRAAASARFS